MFIKFNSRPMLQLSKSGIERAVTLQRNLVQCFVMTYSPRDVFVPFGNCRNEPVIFRAVSLINWNIRNVYTFQTSNSKNTKKRNICFIIYNYQRNYTTESSPFFKATNMINCEYIYGFSDIDECKGNHSCHMNATCTNTDGSYICECHPRFYGNGQSCTGEFNLFAIIFRIFLLEPSLRLLRWPLSAISLVSHV